MLTHAIGYVFRSDRRAGSDTLSYARKSGKAMYQAVPARHFAILAQLVERIHGKDEVPSSILGDGSSTR